MWLDLGRRPKMTPGKLATARQLYDAETQHRRADRRDHRCQPVHRAPGARRAARRDDGEFAVIMVDVRVLGEH